MAQNTHVAVRRNLRSSALVGGILLAAVQPVMAVAIASYNFTGPSTLSTPTVTTTAGATTTAPGLVYPELTPGIPFDLSDGFGVKGRFDFLNGSGTAAELQFTASRPFSITGGAVFTAALQDGFFGIDSADITSGIGSGTLPVTATLTSFTTTTSIQTTGNTVLPGTSSMASDANQVIPLTATDFPTGGYHSVAGPISTSLTAISSGNYILYQSVDIKIGNLLPGESVDIDLPTYSTINSTSVPEPASATLLSVGAGMMLLRRNKSARKRA